MKPHEIRAELVRNQITVTSIATAVGVKRPFVSAVIGGKRPNPRIRQAIAAAINRPVAEVFPDHKEAA